MTGHFLKCIFGRFRTELKNQNVATFATFVATIEWNMLWELQSLLQISFWKKSLSPHFNSCRHIWWMATRLDNTVLECKKQVGIHWSLSGVIYGCSLNDILIRNRRRFIARCDRLVDRHHRHIWVGVLRPDPQIWRSDRPSLAWSTTSGLGRAWRPFRVLENL